MAAARSFGSGSTYQMEVPDGAVAPEVPQKPLSASTTRAPVRAASNAAQVPAGPPPSTSTSQVRWSPDGAEDEKPMMPPDALANAGRHAVARSRSADGAK